MKADKSAVLARLSLAADTEPDERLSEEVAAVRDYIEGTQPLDPTALAEVAYAFVAGIEHATADSATSRRLYAALRTAGLSL